MSVLITGATGFIGRALLPPLLATGATLRIAGRRRPEQVPETADFVPVDLATLTASVAAGLLEGISTVLHLAGHAHAMDGVDQDLHARVNRDATVWLAQAAAKQGARFIYLSSVKAENPAPDDAYGHAKAQAERAIAALLPDAAVILRPCLVIGEGAGGNLARLISLARLPLPLPFACIHAPRSMISRADVVELVLRASQDPRMKGQCFTLADPAPISLAECITALRAGMGRKPGLFPVPSSILDAMLRLAGRSAEAERLLKPSLYAPAGLQALGWAPVLPVRSALRAVGAAHRRG